MLCHGARSGVNCYYLARTVLIQHQEYTASSLVISGIRQNRERVYRKSWALSLYLVTRELYSL